ncbi:MAG: signal peptidase I [Chitinophagaceae bacterium]
MFWIIFLIMTLFSLVGFYKMFEKANIPGWKALIPIYNGLLISKIYHRKGVFNWLNAILLIIPIFNVFAALCYFLDMAKLFGKLSFKESIYSTIFCFIYLPYLGFSKQETYKGYEVVKNYKKSTPRTWFDDLVYAIILVSMIHTFIFQPYVIPTPSMERTLLINDFLFVSKFSYGERIPNTPLTLPFMHHTTPIFKTQSYTTLWQIPYTRYFAKDVQHRDVVVFNFPVGDTVIDRDEYQSAITYYEVCREIGRENVLNHSDEYPIVTRPVDKRENFIKRAVAIGGDTLLIKNATVYINGHIEKESPDQELCYYVFTNPNTFINNDLLKESLDLILDNPIDENVYRIMATKQQIEQLLNYSFVRQIVPIIITWKNKEQSPFRYEYSPVYPYDTINYKWTRDNFGPIWIPKTGESIELNEKNWTLYGRCIDTYENNTVEQKEGKYYINGNETKTYTFKMNYYFMMGDNRDNSLDSRYWAFVPDDHIVGKAIMIWFSWDHGIRWNRMFKMIN